jgi:hypothetical protein
MRSTCGSPPETEGTMDGMIVLVAAVLMIAAGAFVLLSVVPLLAQLRRMSAEAERLLQQLNSGLPPLLKQTSHTLENVPAILRGASPRE